MLTLIVSLNLLAKLVLADRAYAGCYYLPTSGEPAGIDPSNPTDTSLYGETCANRCAEELNTKWSFFWFDNPDPYVAVGHCRCSNDGPDDWTFAPGRLWGECENAVAYSAFLTQSNYLFDACFADKSDQAPDTSVTVDSVEQCLRTCNIDLNALARYDKVAKNFECLCTDPPYYEPLSLGDCVYGSYLAWGYGLNPAQPSGWVKRQQRQRLRREQFRLSNGLCPSGLTACRVEGGNSMAFECVDIDTELESCGGCVNGAYSWGNANATSPLGTE
ncbi:hypothetical protein I317_02741 [Kwoniella heveanensis CBS 569]|nr:hypothetical protein I317_02741 [Kwoniella heveanensis CBS 569]